MVNLGFWQLRRLDEKRAFNDRVRERMGEPVAPVADVLEPVDTVDDADAVVYRRVEASGVYEPDDEVLVRGRSLGGRPGAWVLTPLQTGDGGAIVVNRGWVGSSGVIEQAPVAAGAPDGEVTVTGLVVPTQRKGRFGATDPADGR